MSETDSKLRKSSTATWLKSKLAWLLMLSLTTLPTPTTNFLGKTESKPPKYWPDFDLSHSTGMTQGYASCRSPRLASQGAKQQW